MTNRTASAWMGARVALRRMRGPSIILLTVATVAFTTLVAVAERKLGGLGAASRTIQGPLFGLALPLSIVALVSLAFEHKRAEDAFEPIALLGANRRAALLGAVAGVAVIGAFLATVTACIGTLFAHGIHDPNGPGDAWLTARTGALAGAAYVSYYAAASTFGKRGGGRMIALVANLVFGAMAGIAAIPFPHAHVLNLLGAEPVANLSQRVSSVVLVALTVGYAGIAALRTRR